MEAVAPDRRLAGRYILERPVASGGMATVWRARDEVLARTVAVKILRDDLTSDAEFLERFQREAVAAAALTHSGIISVYDTGLDDGLCYIVLEYADGRSLRQILDEDGALEPAPAVRTMASVLSALAAAHAAGIVHRDVKPGNIVVCRDGRVKVTDFGIAKAAFHQDDLTRTGAILGSVRYLSPEQVEGAVVDARSDLYSAGVVLYESLSGRPPFVAETDLATALMRLTANPPRPRDIRATIPRELESVVMRAMGRRPEDRYQSATSMQAALERSVSDARWAGRRAPPAPMPRPRRQASTFRSWMLAPLILVVAAAGVIAGGLALGRLEFGGPLGLRAAPQSPEAPAGSVPLRITGSRDFDPQGDGIEDAGAVRLATDGNPATVWSTEHYASAAFGGLKQGVGLWISFARQSTVDQIAIASPAAGWQFQVEAGRSPETAGSPLTATDGRTTFTASDSGRTSIRLRPVMSAGLLIWITRLSSGGDRFSASIGSIAVTGTSA